MAHIFLLTFQYYIYNIESLLKLFILRFKYILKTNSNSVSERDRILLRIINIIKLWIEIHPQNFLVSSHLHALLLIFIDSLIFPVLPSAASNLKSFLASKTGIFPFLFPCLLLSSSLDTSILFLFYLYQFFSIFSLFSVACASR